MHLDPLVINAAIDGGATSYLHASPEELAKAVEHVRSGRRYMDRQAAWIMQLALGQ